MELVYFLLHGNKQTQNVYATYQWSWGGLAGFISDSSWSHTSVWFKDFD